MQLAAALQIHAGGPGSGCHGPNCGRPSGPHSNIEPGDKVITLTDSKKWNMGHHHPKFSKTVTVPAGMHGIVKSVTPAVGNTPSMAEVAIGKKGGSGKVVVIPASELFLHEKSKGNKDVPKIDVKDAPKSKTLSKVTTSDGYKFTVLKPSAETVETRKGPHSRKGDFEVVNENVTNIANPSIRSTHLTAPARTDSGDPEGYKTEVNVWVHRDFGNKTVTVQEVKAGEHHYTFGVMQEYRYKGAHALTNAAKFVNYRYGTSLKLPKWKKVGDK